MIRRPPKLTLFPYPTLFRFVLLEIVRDIEVGTPVEIEVPRHDAEAVPFDPAVDAGLAADIGEVAAVVAEQAVAGLRVANGAAAPRAAGALRVGRVVQEVHVQVAVSVVVEERGLGGIAGKIQTVLR